MQVWTMPALSPTMEQGNIAKWVKQVGDEVATGDGLVEVETDKATMMWESVEEGFIAKILAPDGTQDIKVRWGLTCETIRDLQLLVSDQIPSL